MFAGAESGFLVLTQLFDGRGPAIEQVPISEIASVDEIIDRRRLQLYYNVGLARERLAEGSRGDKQDVACVSCLWMDIDLPKEGSKKNYPPMEHIAASLADMPLKYTALVHSGGGLHVYWFFREPHEFADAEAAEKFEQEVSKQWFTLFKVKLARYGQYAIDSVFDVTRMMRIPGSWHKNGKQCTVTEADYSLRYCLEDFAPYLDQINVETLLRKDFSPKFTKKPDGKLSLRKLDALLYNSPAFKKIWERKNTLNNDDSSVDASLIRHAVDANWTDDDIADLVWTFNEKYAPDRLPKLLSHRPKHGSYLGHQIAFVREQASKSRSSIRFGTPDMDAPPRIDDPGLDEPAEQKPMTDEEKRLYNLKQLSQLFDLPIARWIQIGRENPLYTLVLADGMSIRVGGVAAVLESPSVVVQKIYSYFPAKEIKPFTKAEWLKAVHGLGLVVEVVDAPEVTISEMALAGISQFIETQRFSTEKNRDIGLRRGNSYYDGERIHINVAELVKYLNMHGGGHRWNNVEMVSALTSLGFRRETLNYVVDGRRSSKSYWSKEAETFMDVIGCPSSRMSSAS
jgi:hypothetical protein